MSCGCSSSDVVNIWDEGPDTELNLRLDKKRQGLVVGATFNKLVERITSSKDHGITAVLISFSLPLLLLIVPPLHSSLSTPPLPFFLCLPLSISLPPLLP